MEPIPLVLFRIREPEGLHDLIGELSTRSEDFRRRWGAHDVRAHGAGTKRFHHTVVGDLELAYESVDMVSEPGLTLTLYAAEPASPTAHALDLLASWATAPSDSTQSNSSAHADSTAPTDSTTTPRRPG